MHRNKPERKKRRRARVFFFGRNEVSSQAARRVRRQIVRTHIVALLLVSIWVRITVTSRTQKKKTRTASSLFGRNEVIRTPDLLVPNQAHYQAVLHPDADIFSAQIIITQTGGFVNSFFAFPIYKNIGIML